MAGMDMEDDEDIWGPNTPSSPSASPPQPVAASSPCSAFISTQLSLNSRLHFLSSAAAAGGSSPPHSACAGAGIYAAGDVHRHMGLGGGFGNAAAASPAPFFSYNLDSGGCGGVAPSTPAC
ncbi:hypothetical protein HU200_010441 [Digitaria exilis]|uniref:Uncharacterized protein n=1 Tax=Digitaria exilis TaxID=1010633 RepID=A0A835KRT0_9POAL|nr:hypothetical protein HU200_010441 [Digitaria exilis]CAB3457736.1 unnamed protein product [Digitaria exilis]